MLMELIEYCLVASWLKARTPLTKHELKPKIKVKFKCLFALFIGPYFEAYIEVSAQCGKWTLAKLPTCFHISYSESHAIRLFSGQLCSAS